MHFAAISSNLTPFSPRARRVLGKALFKSYFSFV